LVDKLLLGRGGCRKVTGPMYTIHYDAAARTLHIVTEGF
jgi:hypothetical protein